MRLQLQSLKVIKKCNNRHTPVSTKALHSSAFPDVVKVQGRDREYYIYKQGILKLRINRLERWDTGKKVHWDMQNKVESKDTVTHKLGDVGFLKKTLK